MINLINNPGLTFIDLSHNRLVSMDIKHTFLSLFSRHQKLVHIDVAETRIFEILYNNRDDFSQRFRQSMGALEGSLKFLNLSESNLVGSSTAEGFLVNTLETISILKKLEILDLFGNFIGLFSLSDRVKSTFANMLSCLSSLRKLEVHENFLGFDLWSIVSERLKQLPQLESTQYLVSSEDIEYFVSTSVQSGRLVLRNRLISGFVTNVNTLEETQRIYREKFSTIAKNSDTLTSLEVSGFNLYNEFAFEVYFFGEGLYNIALNGQRLQELSLIESNIANCANAEALYWLKEGITAHRSSLKHLDLRINGWTVTIEFALALKDILIELEHLESLNLSGNIFRDEQIIYTYIGDGIRQLPYLRKLVLGNSFQLDMNHEGAKYLIDSISNLDSLQELFLYNVELGSHSAIWPSLTKIFANPSLRGLHLQGNWLYSDANIDELQFYFKSMKQAKNLRALDLTNNHLVVITQVEIQIVDTIKSQENLCTLYLSGNLFGNGPNSMALGDLMGILPRLISYDLRGIAGVDWTEHEGVISETISRDLRSKCESRVCRESKVTVEPPSCPILS